jgi:hypothetical protein
MKTFQSKTLKRLPALLLIPVLYFLIFTGFKKPSYNEPLNSISLNKAKVVYTLPPPGGFTNHIWNNDPDTEPLNWIMNNAGKYKTDLHFTGIHAYDNLDGSNPGTSGYGMFNTDITSGQRTNINSLVTEVMVNEGLGFMYERVKIAKLCYAQRMEYEAEGNGDIDKNYGFSYQTKGADVEIIEDGTGRYVIHADPSVNNTPRVICEDIYENLQHGDMMHANLQAADAGTWYLKPMMKIPTGVSDNTDVVRIDIVNYRNYVIKSITIKAGNFKDNGNYSGGYIEKYFDLAQALEVTGGNGNVHVPPTDLNEGQPGASWWDWKTNCGTDFKIHWYGTVEVWFDKMTVDDEWANGLFSGSFDDRIDNEIEEAKLNGWGFTYFSDEMLHSQIPSLKYVQDKMTYYSGVHGLNPPAKLNFAMNNFLNVVSMKHDSYNYRPFLEVLQPVSFNADAHEFLDAWIPEDAFDPNDLDPRIPDHWKKSDEDYNTFLQNRIFGDKTAVSNETIMENEVWRNSAVPAPWGTFIYEVHNARTQRDTYSPNSKFIMQPMLQFWGKIVSSTDGPEFGWCSREPTNEEIQAQAMVSIAHGADGLSWYLYQSTNYGGPMPRYGPAMVINDNAAGYDLVLGMLDEDTDDGTERHANIFGQDKWDSVASMNLKIEKWKPFLDVLTWNSGWSVHSEGPAHGFITDIMSVDPEMSGQNSTCTNDYQTSGYTSAPYMDCPDERYWEMGFFDHPSGDKYFMMVNRRCIPAFDGTPGNLGDARALRIKFNLTGPTNWTLTDVYSRQTKIFSRTSQGAWGFVDLGSTNGGLGWFKPGEGKLFRLAPTAKTGGTLVANEDISNQTFTCEDTVLNGGYNITIDSASTISFTDSAAIIMSGGTFQSGIHGQNQLTTYKGVGSGDWNGLRFTNSTVKIYNSKFQDIASPLVNYAVKMVNCPLGDIRTNQFVLDTDTAGAVQSVYSSAGFFTGLYINYNSVTMNNSRGYGYAVQGFGGLTLPVYVGSNTMTSNGYATGILLSTITGGDVKSNSITGFSTGINALSSSVDIFGNTITNTSSVSKGIILSGTGNAGLLPSGGVWLGGFNTITNTSGASHNIEVNGSTYLLEGGYNTFDISSNAGAFHLIGSFPTTYSTKSTDNCFKIAGTEITSPSLPRDSVLDNYTEITFDYINYTCGGSLPEGQTVIDIGGGLYDTIPGSSGEGAGYSSRKVLTLTAPQLYDSVRINIRRHNYTAVKTYSEALLEGHASTHEAVSVLQPLYLAVVSTDTTATSITALKNYYAELILDNGENAELVKLCHYLSLKCMVLLGQYSSAMTGFQQIITNNPYSYEGLIAKWDYMATSLLAPGGGGESVESEKLKVESFEFDKFYESEEFDKLYDDKNPLTKEQKQQVYTSVKNVFETTKNDDDRKIKTLEENSAKGDETSKHELKQMMKMKETIKPEKPKSMTEHIAIVSSDVQKVFGNTAPVAETKNTGVPREFSLSQNYPNPFNPVTTIKYSLPQDVKVVIKIYDILGREVRTLVNQVQQTGYYDVKFDGSSLASGVYFYRIEAGDFIVSKKMVLVK